MSQILKRARELREAQRVEEEKEQAEKTKECQEAMSILKQEFEAGFKSVLGMLKEDNIEYSAQRVDPRYPHQGSFIEFTKPGFTPLRMDFINQNNYRFEHVRKGHGSMQYGNWSMDKFILFIAKWLEDEANEKFRV